jgi:ABC-type transporter Mla maintaining outer membrane lipid asymmetry permease subunit MlaE
MGCVVDICSLIPGMGVWMFYHHHGNGFYLQPLNVIIKWLALLLYILEVVCLSFTLKLAHVTEVFHGFP